MIGQVNEETASNPAASLTAPCAEPTFLPNCVDVSDFRPVRTPAGSPLSDEKVRAVNGLRAPFGDRAA